MLSGATEGQRSGPPRSIAGTCRVTGQPTLMGFARTLALILLPVAVWPAQSFAQSKPSDAQQPASGRPDPKVQQNSTGADSPNTTVIGNNNTITIRSEPPDTAFREALPEQVTISLGGGGISSSISLDALRRGDLRSPFMFGGFSPISIGMADGVVYANITLWAGDGKPPIWVRGNEFSVNVPGWDKNFTADALEVVNENGAPVFQLIRRGPADYVVNGYLALPGGGLIEATDAGTVLNPTFVRLTVLKPIFKYPSWKFPKVYADDSTDKLTSAKLGEGLPSSQLEVAEISEGAVTLITKVNESVEAERDSLRALQLQDVRTRPTSFAEIDNKFNEEYLDNYREAMVDLRVKLIGHLKRLPTGSLQPTDLYKPAGFPLSPDEVQRQVADLCRLLDEMQIENGLSPSCHDLSTQ